MERSHGSTYRRYGTVAPRSEKIPAREVLDRIDRLNDLTAGQRFVYYTGHSLVGKRLWAWDNRKGRTVDLQEAAWRRYETGKVTLHVRRRSDGLYDYVAIGK